MVIRGHVKNGVIVLQEGVNLPEGTEVSVVVRAATRGRDEKMTEQQRCKYREALSQIDALPDENPSDSFSGADHDQVLYGDQS